MRSHSPSSPTVADVAVAARRRRLGAAATVATLALGSALAGAGTAAAVADAPVAAAADGTPATPGLAVSLTVHGEDRRVRLADGGARLERVRTVRFAWRSR